MHETEQDLHDLQRVLDESHAAAGGHLRNIFTDETRLTAAELADLLRGVQVLNVATVTAAGEPRVSPVDGLFFRGHFWFGSSHDSMKFRHIRKRPAVSASHTRGEELAVVVHGAAHEVDVQSPEARPFADYCVEVYGESWHDWGASAAYARIEPAKMFSFSAERRGSQPGAAG